MCLFSHHPIQLLSDSSGTESIPENISEDNSESSNFESPIDFKQNPTSSDLLLNAFFDGKMFKSKTCYWEYYIKHTGCAWVKTVNAAGTRIVMMRVSRSINAN